MIIKLIIALGPVGLILLLSEYLWRRKILKDEWARKFIHILAGVWIAFWPFYLPFDGIFILSVAMMTLVIYSRISIVFHAIYDVKRKTYGDIFYGLSIMACSYLGQKPWIFTLSVLLMALADGAAAIVGKLAGSSNSYKIFGLKSLEKSFAGTVAFVLFAQISVMIAWFAGGEDIIRLNVFAVFIGLPLCGAVFENIVPYGVDNLINPILATILLNSLL